MAAYTRTGTRILMFTAGNGSGSRTCTGAKVGDRVVAVWNMTDAASATTLVSSSFETRITVVDAIQQSATNLTSKSCIVLLEPKTQKRK